MIEICLVVCRVYSVNIDNILVWVYEVYSPIIMESGVLYAEFESFFHFQNSNVENNHVDQFSGMVSVILTWNQEHNPSG
jgi:hypothetical protein